MSTQATETGAIRRSITVNCPVEHAFLTFTERIHDWWPLDKHSIEVDEGGPTPETVIFDGQEGRLFERTTKGEELEWARITAFEPPHRFVLSWNPSREERPRTEIEVTFADVDGKTRVDLEHRGWQNLGERGGQVRQGYDSAWSGVLAGYEESASS
jgi:uncharacterized protein YndB with AHSA1/START domain